MGRGPRRGVVGPVVSERVGDNAAAPGVEGLSSLALLALFFRFVIVATNKFVDCCLLERIIVSNNNYLLGIIVSNNKYLSWIIVSKLLSGTIIIWIIVSNNNYRIWIIVSNNNYKPRIP